MPEEFDQETLANAVAEGLRRAMGGNEIRETIAAIVDRNEKASRDNREDEGSVQRRLDEAQRRGNVRFGQPEDAHRLHNAGDGTSPTASVASADASKGYLARMSAGVSGQPYYNIPSGFGEWLGNPTMQNFAEAMAKRQVTKIESTPFGSEERASAIRGYNRAQYFKNEAIPTARMARDFYQNNVQPAYRVAQGLSDVGATQLGGEAVGGNIEAGPFGFRFPINNAFMKGLGMKAHQMKRAMGAGITMDQMAGIDSAMMGMGFNFDNPRFSRGERALETLTKFNPTIDTKLAGLQMENTMRFGTTEQLAEMTKTIESLGQTAASSNVSVQELQTQMYQFQQIAGKAGGLDRTSAQAAGYLQRTMPGMGADQTIQTLMNNPMAQQQVMSMGFMPHQVGAMSGQEMRKAMEGSIEGPWEQVFGKSMDQTTMEDLESVEGMKAMADLQKLYGFDISAEQLKDLIGNKKKRERADRTVDKYFETNKAGEILHGKRGQPKMKNFDTEKHTKIAPAGRGGTRKIEFETTTKEELDEFMRDAGIRGKAADTLRDEISNKMDDGTYRLEKDYRKKLAIAADEQRTGKAGAPADDFNKILKALDMQKQGIEGLKKTIPESTRKNGG